MKKYIPMGAALAIVALFAVAIFASGDVLSFSAPGADVSVGDKAPADQSQPQDYNVSSESYYFGPDFMCQIFVEGSIGCYGSDAYDVVSEVPGGTGFTQIDGGLTYACAYNATDRFNYCWGSITRRPSTTQPTPTPEPTATVAPTATAVANGGTPVPTATPEPTATAAAVPASDSCELPVPATAFLPLTLTGSWTNNCVLGVDLDNVPAGDRYYRWAAIVPYIASSPWNATLTSDQDTVLVLWEWNATTETLDFVEMNDDIVQGSNTNSRIVWTPVVGKTYVFGLTTYNAETLGDFTLTIDTGTSSGQGQIAEGEQSLGRAAEMNAVPLERRQ